MRIVRSLSTDPKKCSVVARGWFGVIGEVKYADYGIQALNGKPGYFVIIGGDPVGSATDFHTASDMLLSDLKVFKDIIV